MKICHVLKYIAIALTFPISLPLILWDRAKVSPIESIPFDISKPIHIFETIRDLHSASPIIATLYESDKLTVWQQLPGVGALIPVYTSMDIGTGSVTRVPNTRVWSWNIDPTKTVTLHISWGLNNLTPTAIASGITYTASFRLNDTRIGNGYLCRI